MHLQDGIAKTVTAYTRGHTARVTPHRRLPRFPDNTLSYMYVHGSKEQVDAKKQHPVLLGWSSARKRSAKKDGSPQQNPERTPPSAAHLPRQSLHVCI